MKVQLLKREMENKEYAVILMKLAVNLLLGVEMQAIAEAVSLGEHLRIDRNVLLDLLFKTTVIPPAFGGKFKRLITVWSRWTPLTPLLLAAAPGAGAGTASLRTNAMCSRCRGSTIFPTCTATPNLSRILIAGRGGGI